MHSVLRINADASQACLLIQDLAQAGIKVSEFTQTQSSGVKIGETLFSLVRDRNLIAYKSDELKAHMMNAVGVETPLGVRMVKGKASKKIDAAIALVMALVSASECGPAGSEDMESCGDRVGGKDMSWDGNNASGHPVDRIMDMAKRGP